MITTMSLTQALKYKERLGREYKNVWAKLLTINSLKEDKHDSYASEYETLKVKADKLFNDLINLKSAIANGNAKGNNEVMNCLAELTGRMTTIQGLNVKEGEFKEQTGGTYQNPFYETVVYKTFINEKAKETLVYNLQKEIDALQDKLDYNNATTNISIDLSYQF